MHFSAQQLRDAVKAQEPETLELLADFVACPSFSGREQTAIAFLEPVLARMGLAPERIPLDSAARHFELISKLPVTCYGPQADSIHGVDEWVSIASMRRVSTVMAQFMQDWCGLESI